MQKNILLKKLNLAQNIYDTHFINKEFLYVYEEKGILKEFCLVFNLGHFKHLTGIEFHNLNEQSKAKNFYRALKNNKIDINNIKTGNFTQIKLEHFSELTDIFYSPAIYYEFAPKRGNSNWLYIDSFISKQHRNIKSTLLGITKEKDNKYSPSSLIYDIPERKGVYIGKVLLIGTREFTPLNKKYNTIFRVSNIDKIPEEIKIRFENLENYNCFTGNIIPNFKHIKGENRWIARADIKKYSIELKKNAKEKVTIIGNIEEDKLYTTPITYYNLSDVVLTKELEEKLVSMKEKIIQKDKEIEKER